MKRVLLDSSCVVAAVAGCHEQHHAALAALEGQDPVAHLDGDPSTESPAGERTTR